jgi:hypothetical protein
MSHYPDRVVEAPGPLTEAKNYHHDIESSPSPPHSKGSKAGSGYSKENYGGELEPTTTVHEGEQKYKRLGWMKLTVLLIVEAIALGSLSVPSAFAAVGMVAGVILCVGIGLIAIYTSYVIGQVKMKYPHIEHYADAVKLIWGRFGYELTGAMFALFLILLVGSHTLTGTIAFIRIVDDPTICALVWAAISAVILFALAVPPSFSEFAILGYIDFVSIIIAIGITIIATGVVAGDSAEGLASVPWSAWPPVGMTLKSAFLATTNIVFAYSFAVCQFSFMSEMHTPSDYVKSIWALGIIEIIIYTLTGALVYAFVGVDVSSPALLSAGVKMSRIAFGIALPVIFISGSINSVVVGRYIMGFWPSPSSPGSSPKPSPSSTPCSESSQLCSSPASPSTSLRCSGFSSSRKESGTPTRRTSSSRSSTLASSASESQSLVWELTLLRLILPTSTLGPRAPCAVLSLATLRRMLRC